MRFSTPQLGRLKRNKLSKFYKITMQSKPGDWGSAVHNGEKHWEHLNHTRSDVQMLFGNMPLFNFEINKKASSGHNLVQAGSNEHTLIVRLLIDLERLEFWHPRAGNAARYFKKLVFIAHHATRHPTYSTEMLSWWLGKGGIPGNYLHHKRHDPQPLERCEGIEHKFYNIILPRLILENAIHDPTRLAKLGKYSQSESVLQGYGYAAGLGLDPISFKSAAWGSQTYNSVIEIKGNSFPPLPIKKADPRTLENQLLASLRPGGSYFFIDGEKHEYHKGDINCKLFEPELDA